MGPGPCARSHPHIHCVVPGGGLSPDHTHWISSRSNFFLPVKVLSRVFRGKFCAGLRRAFHKRWFRIHDPILLKQRSQESAEVAFIRQRQTLNEEGELSRMEWRARSCPAISGSLFPSRRHLQPSDCLRHRIRGALLDQTQEEAPVSSDQPAVQQRPKCHGPMRIIERLTVEEIKNPERSPLLAVDTS